MVTAFGNCLHDGVELLGTRMAAMYANVLPGEASLRASETAVLSWSAVLSSRIEDLTRRLHLTVKIIQCLGWNNLRAMLRHNQRLLLIQRKDDAAALIVLKWLPSYVPCPDAEALLARKGAGKESKLSYCGNLLVENRNGLIVAAEVLQAMERQNVTPRW